MKIGKIILFIFLLLVLAGAFVGWQIFGPAVHNPHHRFLYIKTGSNYGSVKDSLQKNGMISNIFWFDRFAKYAGYPEKVKAGKVDSIFYSVNFRVNSLTSVAHPGIILQPQSIMSIASVYRTAATMGTCSTTTRKITIYCQESCTLVIRI